MISLFVILCAALMGCFAQYLALVMAYGSAGVATAFPYRLAWSSGGDAPYLPSTVSAGAEFAGGFALLGLPYVAALTVAAIVTRHRTFQDSFSTSMSSVTACLLLQVALQAASAAVFRTQLGILGLLVPFMFQLPFLAAALVLFRIIHAAYHRAFRHGVGPRPA
jgi:hypothetical protein